MKKSDRYKAETLEQLWERLQSGEDSLVEIVDSAPEDAEELESLLSLSQALKADLSPEEPSQHFITIAAIRLKNRMRALTSASAPQAKRRPRRIFKLRPLAWFALFALVIALATGGVGVVSAASDALPGDALYGVKLGTERIRLAISLSESRDVSLLEKFTDERLQETKLLLEENRLDDLDQALSSYTSLVEELTLRVAESKPETSPQTSAQVLQQLTKNIIVLEDVQTQAPMQAQPAVQQAIERSQHSSAVMEQLQAGESPSDVAPGQLKKTEQAGEEATGDDGKKPGKADRTKTPGPP